MKRLLNVVYISQPDMYLSLKGQNLNLLKDGESIARVPLHNLEGICTFGYQGASPALMAACMNQNISMTFFTSSGRLRGRVIGMTNGNVILRRTQYRMSDCEQQSTDVAKHMIIGKIYNSEQLLKRTIRDHALRVDVNKLENVIGQLKVARQSALDSTGLEELRGIEGNAASAYFSVFNECILQQKEVFSFQTRSRRPPKDYVNALLSFSYSLLASEVAAALEGVGLDAYVGFLHRDRPGRISLALDIMEELRPVIAERFVLKLINRKQVQANDFIVKENNAVLLKEDARRNFLKLWQEAKVENITHPYLKEKIQWGLIPHVQALLLARFLRGDLDGYPPLLIR
ncbi:type I-C CRISPR-associated endonuclease Cas1c [Massilibacterium senegalense]|uniref:type I-C CRISPR-associated endonuclease Cas1c n=1 Tax=Massilibacterium senegalense TaxID=1632858 RepID=UPI000782288E|nr:type I-C CRISPR-associated endonuclease Cas1c [Massilibacterium senegalense]